MFSQLFYAAKILNFIHNFSAKKKCIIVSKTLLLFPLKAICHFVKINNSLKSKKSILKKNERNIRFKKGK